MEYIDLLDISKQAIYTYLKISLPILLSALIVGLIISLFQALTQIQESTLTFVPKIIAVFLCIILSVSFISNQLITLMNNIETRIIFPDGEIPNIKNIGRTKN